MMNNETQADKPAVITASEFVRDGYAAKIATGECVVTYTLNDKVVKVSSSPASLHNLQRNITHRLHFVNLDDSVDMDDVFDTTAYAQLTVRWPTGQPASDGGAAGFVNPTRAYEETLTCDELLKRLDDQARIIHELYTGKHGVIPHPSEVWQPGLWEVYKGDEHQGHAEKVGEVGELATLREALAASRLREARLLEANATLEKRLKKLTRKSNLDDGFIDFLTVKGDE